MDILETVDINILEVLDDLRSQWLEHKDYNFNKTALTNRKNLTEDIQMCCPFHPEKKPSFGIKLNYPFTWQCFSCGVSGNLAHLVKHVLDLPTIVHAEYYLTKNYVDFSSESRLELNIDGILDGVGSHKNSTENISDYLGKRHQYMYNRGFSERTLSKYEVGYDQENQSMVMPVRTTSGDIRFFKRRSVHGRVFLNEEGIYKKDILYGLHYLVKAMGRVPKVYLTESETDTLACYQAGLPSASLMGRLLFKEQVQELLRAGVEEVALFLDNDRWGQEAIHKVYELLCKTPMRVSVVKYPIHLGIDTNNPEEILYKDANDLLKSKLIEKITILNYEEFIIFKRGNFHVN